ncbi:hypothetical protein [Mesorhizobium onobrychidis]|uniref:DUF3899 domain-containing protein n=1 Tax=Mesorhizobium onobrychidis TaxID=2775404 RepID=A0ABY5QRH1_9HYPH|nr:hypothetical protein [Mesorhizobium onobrychidis]UVC13780.1 hypothetical protein IHQ72_24200 [Mesorhizobium onobrychidis]
MLERKDFLDAKQSITATISEICRYIAFGLLVAFYTIRTDSSPFAKELQSYGLLVFLVGFCGAAAILSDYLQYVFGKVTVDRALLEQMYEYDDTSLPYQGRKQAFDAKQLFVGVGALSLAIMVVLASFDPIHSCF